MLVDEIGRHLTKNMGALPLNAKLRDLWGS
jgi:hypothetical protein